MARAVGAKSALIVGVGMVPRGEVGIIVATLGLQQGVFNKEIYALIIAMSLLTSIIAPPILKLQFARIQKEETEESASPVANAL